MIISHNTTAMNVNRITNENISLHGKSTRRVSSGYRINCGVDDPAGLGLSEVMRRQIRGLMQATNNTKDGVAFVQSADGAMDEIHSILQRMNELTVKALQGTYSDSDRMALNVEFDQLRTEIDRINHTTEFGTDFPVFEEHEPSYYKICGNRKWDDNQLHTISSMANALKIHLPDSYEPKDYTITVPAGVYTTQELVDEIDDALSSMVPPNPGFVFELTSDGYCNLSFEKADGTPTKIDYVDGSLSYLIYDFQMGMGANDILGTTIFKPDDEGLVIVEGKNDELGFYLEGINDGITIKIPAGRYTRDDLINIINTSGKLPQGVVAAEFGDYCIQIRGGNDVTITGLYGNMFKYEGIAPVYSSVFYDNVKYGTCNKWPAIITGKTNELPIRISESNHILKFKVNGVSDITLDIPYDSDTGYKDYSVQELADELKRLLGTREDVEINVINNRLSLSTKTEGELSSLEFDISESRYENTYRTLFFGTSELPESKPSSLAGVTGIPDLSGGIVLDENDSFRLFIMEGDAISICNFNGLKGTYDTLDDLVTALNNKLTPALKDKIIFESSSSSSGSNLIISALTSDVGIIGVDTENAIDTYAKLFSGEIVELQGSFTVEQQGKKETIEGTTTINLTDSIVKSSKCKDPSSITIDENSNTITFRLSSSGSRIERTITIEPGTYDLLTLAKKINEQLGENSTDQYLRNISAEMYGDCLRFIFTPTEIMSDGNWTIDISYDSKDDAFSNSVWKEFFESESKPGIKAHSAKPATLTTMVIPMGTGIVIDGNNCSLELSIDGGENYVTLPKIALGTYNNLGSLAAAIRTAINNSTLKGEVSVDVVEGKLQFTIDNFTTDSGTFEARGTFYDEVMCRGVNASRDPLIKGICNYDPAFIVGRQDLTVESIEIISGSNDIFTFDFTHNNDKREISVEIPEGVYNGSELADVLEQLIQNKFNEMGRDDIEVDVSIGGHNLGLENTNDSTVLQITLNQAPGKEPDEGQYIIDGIRGSAANSIFYKSTTTPTMTYIVGTKNIQGGISFEPGKNVLTLSANSVPYKYTFDKPYYTADEFIDALNSMFENGDDNGNSAPLRASIDKSGALKISYTVAGANTITDIGGSARSTIFFEEEGRDSRDPLLIHVGSEAHQNMEIPRISVSSTALAINTITISKQKYAEKANVRIKEAINLLSSKRSTYGAIQNRLEHTINSNNNVTDCMQASESRIRDTDLSTEMTQYTNLGILLRMGSTMIAESNKRIEKLMTILQ